MGGAGACGTWAEVGEGAEEDEEEADPSPPFAKDATGFPSAALGASGMTAEGWVAGIG